MKRLVLILIMVMAASTVPLLAEARDRGFNPGLQAQGQQARKGPGDFRRGDQDFRREREVRPRDERQRQPGGRMTEEERRELHRDLDRANREIYRPRGR
jgi:hypothetical protein